MLNSNKNKLYCALSVLAIFSLVFFYTIQINLGAIVDESTHVWEITQFSRFNFVLLDHLTTIPGYHLLNALFQRYITFSDTLWTKRLFSVLIGLISVLIFYLIHKKIQKKGTIIKTLQYAVCPLFFPFFFLVYTDITALLFILLGLLFLYRKNYILMGLFANSSLIIRQTSIVWHVFLLSQVFFSGSQNFKQMLNISPRLKKLGEFIVNNLVALFGLFSFIYFLIWNGGIALGDKAQHPSFSFHFGNIYFFLFVILLINLPIFVSYAPKILTIVKSKLKRPRDIVAMISILILSYILFTVTFEISHAYNQYPFYYWILRNIFLHYVSTYLWLKIPFFLLLVYSTSVLTIIDFKSQKNKIILYLFIILSLIPSWLIEIRYAIPGMAIFMLYRISQNKKTEIIQLAYNAALSGILFYVISTTYYFP